MKKNIVNQIKAKKPLPKIVTVKRYYPCNEDESEFGISDEDNLEYRSSDTFLFRAQIAEFDFCCGVFEIGDISSNIKVFTSELEKTLDEALLNLVSAETLPKTCRTFVANLIDNTPCNRLRASFIRTGLFTLVKTFTNSGSRNKIEIWVSNN